MINSGRVQIIKTRKSTEIVEDLLVCVKSYENYYDDKCDKGDLRIGMSYYANLEHYNKVNLYVTSDYEVPKHGDYVYHSTYPDTIWKMEEKDGRNFGVSMNYDNKEPYELIGFLKIISTNDKALINEGLNSLDNHFINKFIELYNQNHSFSKITYLTNTLRTHLRDGGSIDSISYGFVFVNEEKCETGCMHYHGGEIRHNKDCVFYSDSLSKKYDEIDLKSKINEHAAEEYIKKLELTKSSQAPGLLVGFIEGAKWKENSRDIIDDADTYSYNKALLIFKESEGRDANMDNLKDMGAVSAIQLGYQQCMVEHKI